ncbi:hypothetical protein [Rubritalea tangerina]|uniref:hypothetical protein n=1 Tax=Rubritalea tangerina TaxID=430798 RepID=UPI003611A939
MTPLPSPILPALKKLTAIPTNSNRSPRSMAVPNVPTPPLKPPHIADTQTTLPSSPKTRLPQAPSPRLLSQTIRFTWLITV